MAQATRVIAPEAEGKAVALVHQLEELQDEMRLRYARSSAVFAGVHPAHRQSAANLIDYLTLRGHDLRPLQRSLAELGLSSLGRAEEHVMTTLERVLDTLRMLAGVHDGKRTESAVSFARGRESLAANARDLLGPSPAGRATRILVTMPSEAAGDTGLVEDLLARGMDCARINGAHDEPSAWAAMVTNLRAGAARAGRPCPILMDLPGPKLRTGPVAPGPPVVRLRPARDALGRCTVPARCRLVAAGPGRPAGDAGDDMPSLPVPAPWLSGLAVGTVVALRDTRDSRRTLEVRSVAPGQAVVAVADTTYVQTGTRLVDPAGHTAPVGPLPPVEQHLLVHRGDVLTLSGRSPPVPAEPGTLRIGCTAPEVVDALDGGHRVFFDDGRIGGTVVRRRPDEVDIEITRAAPQGSKLRGGKGINVPDSRVVLGAWGTGDEAVLGAVVGQADLVGLSFAQDPDDVTALQQRLEARHGADLGIVLKVETTQGFAALPEMVLAAMRSPRFGVMVARGDLAVECGFERLAEVQEEMLWLCDAGHVPVIWATQVLDQLARTGQPSRAEISDAAMAQRAECVMLNKGPYILEAVTALDDILRRMAGHQEKHVPLLRPLRSWTGAPG